MKQWYESKYGKVPFQEVVLVGFSFDTPENKEATAFIQYNLLLNDKILQAHLEHSNGFGKIVLLSDVNAETVLKEAGLKYKIDSKEIISYEKLVDSNNQFE